MTSEFQNEFSSGICDCCAGDDGFKTCCVTYWCPCIQFGWNVERLEPQYGAWCAGDFMAGCGLYFVALLIGSGVLNIIPQMNSRQAIRRKYKIKGNLFGDCCTAFWCTACAICQEHRQLKEPAPVEEFSPVPGYPVTAPQTTEMSKAAY